MKKKIFLVIMLNIIFALLSINVAVNAATTQEVEILDELEEDKTIMKYDARTGKTTEVDMEEVKQVVQTLRKAQGKPVNKAESYSKGQIMENKFREKSVFANNLVLVSDTTKFPYNAVCRLNWRFDESHIEVGTGALVGPRLLLTNAHCVMNKDNKNSYFAEWKCEPGYNGDGNGLITGWAQIYYPRVWTTWHRDEYDWCLCVLEDDLGNLVGEYYGAQSYGTNAELEGMEIVILGYPDFVENPRAKYQYTSTGKITDVYEHYFENNAKVYEGMSGGPIVRSDAEMVGINKGYLKKDENMSYGVRITQEMIDLINQLR